MTLREPFQVGSLYETDEILYGLWEPTAEGEYIPTGRKVLFLTKISGITKERYFFLDLTTKRKVSFSFASSRPILPFTFLVSA